MDLPTSEQYYKHSVESFDTSKLLEKAARQRDERKFEDVLIIDVDSHHYESDSHGEIIEFIEDPVLRQLAQSSRQISQRGGGMLNLNRVGYQDIGGRVTRYPLRKLEATPTDGRHRDVHLTERWMDAMGVDYTCMFPTPMLGLAMHPQVEVEVALARAYNRWLVEKVLPGSSRIKSMLFLPLNDHQAAYRMVKEFGDKPGVIGFMITTVRHKPVHDNDYMKVYAAIEELGLPLGFHSGFNWNDPLLKSCNKFLAVHALGFTWHNVVHCTNWVVNGMQERFPKLSVVWIEAGLAWIPWLMQRLDTEFRMRSSECPSLKRLPSEYMREMFYTSQPMERPDHSNETYLLEATFKTIHAQTQLLYASDYPHWDMDLPNTIWDLPFLTETAKRNILGESARKVFNIDVSARFPNYKPPV